MADADAQQSEPRRRKRAGQTRAVLLEACLNLVRSEGVGALSVQRVAGVAGISPPGFYKHFSNTDELLGVALGGVMADMARRQSVSAALDRIDIGGELPSTELVREIVDSMLGILLEERRVAELYMRYRNDPTMLGGAVTAVAQQVLDETVAIFWGQAQRLGALPESYARVAIFAEQLLALYYRAGEMLLSGRYSRELVVATTASSLFTLTMQIMDEHKSVLVWQP